MANEHGEPFVLDFPNGQRVEDILKKAEANYSKAEIDMKMSSKANAVDVYNKTEVDIALRSKVDKVSGKGLSTNDYTTADKEKLAGIETQANKTVVDDTLDNTSTNPVQNKVVKAALDNKADTADIPTVPITAIQKNGTGITPVSGTVNITVPTQASDINAATATQGDKADTAIQGIKVNSSTVNPDANKVVDITVPTTAAEVSALPDTTKYAATLSLTINSSTFVMTGQLKDQNGDNLGTAQTIDLPLESVVVGGSYNSQTKKVVLTLQNGNTIEFSVADLVAGLQTELSESNKLNPAYIAYDSTHRAVSDTEKSTWNGKQNALSSTQLDAVNSGIDSEKVEQIETNKNNISTANAELIELVDNGAKNKLPDKGTMTKDDIRYTWTGGDVVVSGTKSAGANYVDVLSYVELSDLGFNAGDKFIISNNGTNCYLSIIFWSQSQGYTSSIDVITGSNEITVPTGYTHIIARLGVVSAATGTISETIQPMICSKAAWNISQKFVPYRPTYEETVEQVAENENNILSLAIANGKKQIIPYFGTVSQGNIICTQSGNAITVSGTKGEALLNINISTISYSDAGIRAGDTLIMTNDNTNVSIALYFFDGANYSSAVIAQNETTNVIVPSDYDHILIRLVCAATITTINETIHPMICQKVLYEASPAVTPYSMSNAELTANISKQQNTTTQGGNGYAIINGVRQYTGDTVTPPVPPNSLWIKDSVKVKSDNYFNADDFGAIQADAQGNLRCGTNCGVLPQGTYTLTATTSASQISLFHTIKSGNTYALVTIDSLPYTFTSDGVSEQIIRVANATTTSWAENGYTNIMLNTGNTAQNYVPYWTDVIDEKINPLENNILTLADSFGTKNLLNVTLDTIKALNTSGTWTNNVFSHDNGGIFTINSDLTVDVDTTNSTGNNYFWIGDVNVDSSIEYVLSGSPSGGANNTYFIKINDTSFIDTGNSINVTGISTGRIVIGVLAGTRTTLRYKPMVCLKTMWDISHTYQPYAMSNAELTNDISFVQQMNGKSLNLINTYDINKIKSLNTGGVWTNNTYTSTNNGSITINTDGTITVDGNFTAGTTFNLQLLSLENGDYYFSGCPLGGSAGVQNGYFLAIKFQRNSTQYVVDVGNGNFYTKVDGDTGITLQLWVRPQTNINNKLWKIYLVSKAAYDAGFTDYQPYALSNAELTAKEQQNENNILTVEKIQGAKNILNVTATSTGMFTVNSDKTVDAYGTAGSGYNVLILGSITVPANKYYLLGCTTGNNYTYYMDIMQTNPSKQIICTTQPVLIDKDFSNASVRIVIGRNVGDVDAHFEPMIVPREIIDAGFTDYQPYAMSNAELTAKEQQNENNISSITPRTVMYTYTPTATDTYELIPQFTVTLPANKTICITAAGYRNGNNKITGVQIQQSDTQDNENVIGIAESNTLYRCLTATGTYKNTSNANTTINVYIKCDAAGVLHNCNIFYWII